MLESHKRFADKYFETLNGSLSAEFAGFSKDTARQQAWTLLQREDIQEYLQALRADYAEKSGITKEWIIERFRHISDACVQAKPVMVRQGRSFVQATDEDGEGIWQFDSAGANTATAHLGKIIGVFEKDNSQSHPSATTVINLGAGTEPNDTTPEAE